MKFSGRLASRNQTDIRGLSILLALYHLGGSAPAGRVLEHLEHVLAPALETRDKEPEVPDGKKISDHRWHHLIHGTLSHPQTGLRTNGYMLPARQSGFGIWSLSEKGHRRIQTLLKDGRDPETPITLRELVDNLNLQFINGQDMAPPLPEQLDGVPSRRGRPPRQSVPEYNSESRQSQVLAEEIARIRDFLNGSGALRPDDQTLCDWVWFCYRFEMYAEGTTLFPLIHSESVDRWLYDRTKKLAEICALRKE